MIDNIFDFKYVMSQKSKTGFRKFGKMPIAVLLS